MSTRLASRALVGAAMLVLVIGCSPVSRGVGSQPPSVTITLATAFESNMEAQPFVDAVSRLSGGSIADRLKGRVHAGEDAIEQSLLDDVAAGTYDMTWTAQRPWPARGNKAFDALVAPFLIDSYDLERAVLEDPIADQMIGERQWLRPRRDRRPARPAPGHRRSQTGSPAERSRGRGGRHRRHLGWRCDREGARGNNHHSNERQPGNADRGGRAAGRDRRQSLVQELPNVAAGIPFWPRPVIVVMNQARFDAAVRATSDECSMTASRHRSLDAPSSSQPKTTGTWNRCVRLPASRSPRLKSGRRSGRPRPPCTSSSNRDPATASFIQRIDA